MQSSSKNPSEIARLRADFAAANVELLSAHCATDRIRLRYSLHDIAHFGEQDELRKAITSASALCRFFSQLEAQIQGQED